jgi:hypothetical protein
VNKEVEMIQCLIFYLIHLKDFHQDMLMLGQTGELLEDDSRQLVEKIKQARSDICI